MENGLEDSMAEFGLNETNPTLMNENMNQEENNGSVYDPLYQGEGQKEGEMEDLSIRNEETESIPSYHQSYPFIIEETPKESIVIDNEVQKSMSRAPDSVEPRKGHNEKKESKRQQIQGQRNNEIDKEIVTLDVGGTIFRCRRSLFTASPQSKLQEMINIIGRDKTCFFIDRNPRYFEPILDWHRTKKYYLNAGIHQLSVQDEAKYWNIYKDMFGTTSLTMNTSCQTLVEEKVEENKVIYYSKILQEKLSPSTVPCLFYLRSHEQLSIDSISGQGRLYLQVHDKYNQMQVPQATVYDSNSYFYLAGRKSTKFDHILLPSDFIYSFWVEQEDTASEPMEINFKLIYEFSTLDKMEQPSGNSSLSNASRGMKETKQLDSNTRSSAMNTSEKFKLKKGEDKSRLQPIAFDVPLKSPSSDNYPVGGLLNPTYQEPFLPDIPKSTTKQVMNTLPSSKPSQDAGRLPSFTSSSTPITKPRKPSYFPSSDKETKPRQTSQAKHPTKI